MQQILLTLIRSIECERNMMTVLRVYLNVYTFAGIRFFFFVYSVCLFRCQKAIPIIAVSFSCN